MTTKDHKAGSTASLKNKLKDEEGEEQLLEHPSYEELQQKLTEAEEKASQNWDRMLRMQAEMENLRRRVDRDIEGAHKYALEKFTLELLPIIDSFEKAVSIKDESANSIIEGIDMTLKMLYTSLEKFGIQQIDPLSQPFNPELHQAVSTQADPNVAPNTVINVLQKGYLLNNRLVRPALVIVSKTS